MLKNNQQYKDQVSCVTFFNESSLVSKFKFLTKMTCPADVSLSESKIDNAMRLLPE
jgi:beta-glucosidase/6-phospho-beta-glucosidase/beta-galactosidase